MLQTKKKFLLSLLLLLPTLLYGQESMDRRTGLLHLIISDLVIRDGELQLERNNTSRILKDLREKIDALKTLRKDAIRDWRITQLEEKIGLARCNEVRTHFEELESSAANLRQALSESRGAATKGSKLQDMRTKALGLTKKVIDMTQRIKDLAADIRSTDQVRQIIHLQEESKNITLELTLLAKAAESTKAELNAIQTGSANLRLKQDAIQANFTIVQRAETTFKARARDAEAKKAEFEHQKAMLLERFRTLRPLFLADSDAGFESESSAESEAFHKLHTQAMSFLPISEFKQEDLGSAKVEQYRKKCEELLGKANKLLAELEGLYTGFRKEKVDEDVSTIQAVARDARHAMEGTEEIVEKARELDKTGKFAKKSSLIQREKIVKAGSVGKGEVSYLGAQIVEHEGAGIKVVGVIEDSPAQHAGLQNGDLILEAEDHSFREQGYELKSFTKAISKLPEDRPIRFRVKRDAKSFDVWIKLEKIDKAKLAALIKDTGQQFRSTYEKGWKMLMNQDYEGALDHFQKTVEAYPKHSYRAIGICYYHMGHHKDAFKYIEKAYVMDKKSPLTVFYVAACYDKFGKEKVAIHYYKKYLGLKHDNSQMNEIARTRLNELRKKHQISKDTFLKIIEAIKREVKEEKGA